MKFLVLGGTGYVGRRVSELLLAGGHDVAVVSRGQKHPSVLGEVEHLQLDRKDHEQFAAALRTRQFDAVIDTIAYEGDDARSSIEALRGRAGQYLFISSVAVYDRRQLIRPLIESDADVSRELDAARAEGGFHPSGRLNYALGKREVERLFLENGRDLPWTSLRAPIVVGPDDRTLRIWWFVQRIQDGGPLIFPDWGHGRIFQVVTADALAGAFLACSGNAVTFCKAYNLAQPELFTAETWTEGLAGALGTTAECVRVPEQLLPAAGLDSYAMPIAGRGFGHVLLDISAARRDFGFDPLPSEAWLADTAQGCAASPPAVDSGGYDRRSLEIDVARRYQALIDEAQHRFTAAGGG